MISIAVAGRGGIPLPLARTEFTECEWYCTDEDCRDKAPRRSKPGMAESQVDTDHQQQGGSKDGGAGRFRDDPRRCRGAGGRRSAADAHPSFIGRPLLFADRLMRLGCANDIGVQLMERNPRCLFEG